MSLSRIALLSIIALAFLFTSCGSDESNGPLTAEKMTGEWQAVETNNGVTSTFTMTINQMDGNITFNDGRSPAPVSSLQFYSFPYNEEDQTFTLGTVDGVVENENRIVVDYAFGSAAGIFDISVVLTR